MTAHSHPTTSALFLPRLPFPALPRRLPRPDRQGLSRRELRDLVAEMLG